jgi:hypothetical protein
VIPIRLPWTAGRALILVALVHVLNVILFLGVLNTFDSIWAIPTARNLLDKGHVYLDDDQDMLARQHFFAIESVDGHYYSIFPIGTPLLAVPVIAVLDAIGIRSHPTKVEKFVASQVVTFTAVVLYALARRSLDTVRALLLTFIFVFCTPAWSTASRGLWQHGRACSCSRSRCGSSSLPVRGRRSSSSRACRWRSPS